MQQRGLDLLTYTTRTFPSYRAAAHHRLLAEKLQAVARGEITRLMVWMPPRHGKSELVSRRFPAWYLGQHPDKRFIGTSYAAALAQSFSGSARNQFRDARWPWPAVRLAADTTAKSLWDIAGHRGGYVAAGVGGPITGQGADILLIDDPVKNRQDADSQTKRDAVWEWYTSTAYTRLEGSGGAIVVVQTRWHEDDLSGRLLREAGQGGEQWDVVALPALAEEGDPLGRPPGAPLWPEKFDAETLEGIRTTIGSRDWSALYQQRPTPQEGAMFKRQWFEVVDAYPEGLRWVRYWDLAASTRTAADYTSSCACALADDGALYVRDMVRGRWEWPDAQRIMRMTMKAEPRVEHYIEEALHGLAAVQEFRRMPDVAHVALRGVHVDRDKVQRAMAWNARAEAGKVRLVRGSWVNAFLDEVTSFPLGEHDDQVDAVSGCIPPLANVRRWVGV